MYLKPLVQSRVVGLFAIFSNTPSQRWGIHMQNQRTFNTGILTNIHAHIHTYI